MRLSKRRSKKGRGARRRKRKKGYHNCEGACEFQEKHVEVVGGIVFSYVLIPNFLACCLWLYLAVAPLLLVISQFVLRFVRESGCIVAYVSTSHSIFFPLHLFA